MTNAAPIIFLMGPTASGKTDCAVDLVTHFDLEIVSVDSAMVYRGLNIGSGKPDEQTLAAAPHRLIDIREPNEPYSAAQFHSDALAAIKQIQQAGRIPLFVGGTSLYFRALRFGLSPLPPADAQVRNRLQAEEREHGLLALHERLRALDPLAAARIHATDPQRIHRALEVVELTGSTLTELHARDRGQQCPYPIVSFSIEPGERSWLHARIEQRFHAMLAAGFEQEVRALRRDFQLSREWPAVRAVGYRQMHDYLDMLERGDFEPGSEQQQAAHEAMATASVVATRQLARRQLTWLRSEDVQHRLAADAADLQQQLRDALAGALYT